MRITILCLLLSCSAFVAADDHAPSPFMPVEIFGCSYNEGKGLEDLLAVGKKWSKWADKEIEYDLWDLPPKEAKTLKEQVHWRIWHKARLGDNKSIEILAKLGCLDD